MKTILLLILATQLLSADSLFEAMKRQKENKDFGVQVVPSRQWCEHLWCIEYLSYLEMGSYSCMDTRQLKELIKLWQKEKQQSSYY